MMVSSARTETPLADYDRYNTFYDTLVYLFLIMKQLVFGVHLPVMGFNSSSDRRNGPHTGEQMLSIARKAESLGYDSLSVNDHIVFRTSWLDSLVHCQQLPQSPIG